MARLGDFVRKNIWSRGAVLTTAALFICCGYSAAAQPSSGTSTTQAQEQINELRKDLQQALDEIQVLQQKVNARSAGSANENATQLEREVENERLRIEALEERLDQLAASAPTAAPAPEATAPVAEPAAESKGSKKLLSEARGSESTPGVTTGFDPADIYNNGFYVSTPDKRYSMYLNGLFQTRFTWFKPGASVAQFGASPSSVNNFDVYLGRFAASGSAFSPTLKYFLQFQGSTAGNGNGVSLLDWFTAKTFSKYLTVQAGRFWTPFTYEYYDSPGNYLFADLSTAEFAFVLPRAVGFEAYGQAGRLSYAGVVANSIPALDAPGQENFNSRAAFIGNLHYDVLAPYGYVETDPSRGGAKKPELTLWASGAYNPVTGASSFENTVAGDKTVNATATAGFRYGYFTLQSTGYYRRTTPATPTPSDNSWGFGEQAGYYLIPARLELAGRVSGVNWGAAHFLASGFPVNNWYSGPNFPYHNVTEHSIGLNYYLYGHHAKLQMSYSYLTGNTFTHTTFDANRIWIQSQIMF